MIDTHALKRFLKRVQKWKAEVIQNEKDHAEDINQWSSIYWMVESLEIALDELIVELKENEDIYG